MQHTDLQGNRWYQLSLVEQMANIGSEVERAIKWKSKGNIEYGNLANIRALELFDLTLSDSRHGKGIKEIARARELWLDYFVGENQYHQTEDQWKKYFYVFTFAARNYLTSSTRL
jgi:hypothetical protein